MMILLPVVVRVCGLMAIALAILGPHTTPSRAGGGGAAAASTAISGYIATWQPCSGGSCGWEMAGMEEEEEWLMESGTASRILLQGKSKYITPPASIPDRPFGGSAGSGQPYKRGCQTTYDCKQGTYDPPRN